MSITAKSGSAWHSIQRYLLLGSMLSVLLTFGVGGWAATTELAGAVIAQGSLVVDSSVKKVQHPSGGVVSELRVRNGDHVRAGDVLLRLDETQSKAAATIILKNVDELLARQARLEAERDKAPQLTFAPSLLEAARDPGSDAANAIASERNLFQLRRQARDGQKSQLEKRCSQLQEEITGYSGQLDAKRKEVALIQKELEGVRTLWEQKLVPISRLTVLERDATRIEGERSQLAGVIAQTQGKISETELQIIQIDQDLRSEVGKELIEVRSKLSELAERKTAAVDQLKRIDIRAPHSGTIHQLAVHTIGGVIQPGEQIMLIVPDTDTLTVEAKIAPQDIDHVYAGQPAVLRFSAFNQHTTPEITGQVSVVSADLTQDQRSGISFYTARIALGAEEVRRLGNVKLVPGMPVDAHIQLSARTALSYLMKPLRDQASRAFKER
jgi:HlyD family secretion protein